MLSLVGVGYVQGFGCAIILDEEAGEEMEKDKTIRFISVKALYGNLN